MRMMPLAVCALLLVTATVRADEAQEPKPREQTMAERAAAARTKRKPGGKVITNEDVRKSKGRLSETTGPLEPLEPAPSQSTTERHEADRKARAAAAAQRAAAEELVRNLERQLLAIEQSYYEENDLERRDGELVRRFDDISRQLADARKQLAGLDGTTTPTP